jgi:hypothetical protein
MQVKPGVIRSFIPWRHSKRRIELAEHASFEPQFLTSPRPQIVNRGSRGSWVGSDMPEPLTTEITGKAKSGFCSSLWHRGGPRYRCGSQTFTKSIP